MGSFSIGHWVIVALVILVVFGTKKLGSAGADLGKAIKGFKDEVNTKSESSDESSPAKPAMLADLAGKSDKS